MTVALRLVPLASSPCCHEQRSGSPPDTIAASESAKPSPVRLRLTTLSLPSVAEEDLEVEEDEALAAWACQNDGNSGEGANSMRIRTATGRMGGARLLCVGQTAGVVPAELSVHSCLEPFRALGLHPLLSIYTFHCGNITR